MIGCYNSLARLTVISSLQFHRKTVQRGEMYITETFRRFSVALSSNQPLDFRQDEVQYVIKQWRAGESVSLVGVGSVGKSNLLDHLTDPEIQAHFLRTAPDKNIKAIKIDPNMLGPLPLPAGSSDAVAIRCWSGYELLMHRVFLAFYPFKVLEKQEARRFYEIYQALQDGTNPIYPYMGIRYLELGLDFFLRRGVHLVFIFDDFEEMLLQMPVKFFQTLRGLRDNHKYRLSYTTFTRSPLSELIDRHAIPRDKIEGFLELFTDNVCYVGPYNLRDAHRMIDRLTNRYQVTYSGHIQDALLRVTGNHAGLLRACYRALASLDAHRLSDEALADELISLPPVRDECNGVWMSLNATEQQVLTRVAHDEDRDISQQKLQIINTLIQKQLLRADNNNLHLEVSPPIFKAFVTTLSKTG